MAPAPDFNKGISQSEIDSLDQWSHAMMRDAWAHKPWPTRLYHYTTPAGFAGIVESGVLRATHVGFTNDFQEYRHAVALALEIGLKLRNDANGELRDLLDAVCDNFAATTLFNMHPYGIACFSEHPDKLSQWRAYGVGEGGIAIGFDRHDLVTLANNEGDFLAPVVYRRDDQTKLIRAAFEWMLTEFPKQSASYRDETKKEHLQAWLWNWAYRASYIAPVFKDAGFQEEDEWRLVRRFLNIAEAGFVPKGTHLSPYLTMRVGANRNHPDTWNASDPRRAKPMPPKLPIVELWFGPGRYQEQAHASCKFLLEYYDYGGVQLHASKTPFRAIT